MSAGESDYLKKAHQMLAQARAMSPTDAPESVVHLCNYARFHAATAVLLRHRGSVAMTHTGLIGAFGCLSKDLGEPAPQHGRALKRAEDLRLRADDGVSRDPRPR